MNMRILSIAIITLFLFQAAAISAFNCSEREKTCCCKADHGKCCCNGEAGAPSKSRNQFPDKNKNQCCSLPVPSTAGEKAVFFSQTRLDGALFFSDVVTTEVFQKLSDRSSSTIPHESPPGIGALHAFSIPLRI
jgi:hypothetical protein